MHERDLAGDEVLAQRVAAGVVLDPPAGFDGAGVGFTLQAGERLDVSARVESGVRAASVGIQMHVRFSFVEGVRHEVRPTSANSLNHDRKPEKLPC